MSKNKVTIQEPEERAEGPEREVNALYEVVDGSLYSGDVYLATTGNFLVNVRRGSHWDGDRRFNGDKHLFRRLPPGTKVTITVGGKGL